MRSQAPHDTGRDPLRENEQLRDVSVIPVGRNHRATRDVGKLNRNPQKAFHPPDAAADRVAYTQVLADFLQVDRSSTISERRRARDHEEATDAGQGEDDIVDHSFAEIGAIGIIVARAER